ncbi:molecular chaperone GrpE [Methylohalomonas lacus]|uniref:Protein GrpE n=1 Tax=Methylohalomonas lacus TaxID=398773 RepID=A0AAE3L1A2_9GAMM|nr:nucleotide exchange factor GrpE [Methylohalomonas lacus]MCS3903699.1 molecular chaperone GrpE [Methylohalomonas lacus]
MASHSEQTTAGSGQAGSDHDAQAPEEETAVAGEVLEEDASAAVTPESDDPAVLQAELNAARAKAEEHWSNLVRLQAEMDNLRKRTSRDVEQAHKYALDKFVAELLPVIDSLELGINAAGENSGEEAASLREGMELTLKKLLDAVAKFGVETVNPQGEKFNPELHEAVSMQESAEAESNTVITVVQKGYTLNDRLVRPAMVVVAK